jgi:hypothetical protein
MKKLAKATLAARTELVEKLGTSYSELEEAVGQFNDTMNEAWVDLENAINAYNEKLDTAWGEKLEPAITSYNEVVGEANEWKQDVVSSIEEFMNEKSEKWQESDAASRYESWKDNFTDEFSTYDQDRPEDMNPEQPDHILEFNADNIAEELEQLPEEVDS